MVGFWGVIRLGVQKLGLVYESSMSNYYGNDRVYVEHDDVMNADRRIEHKRKQ